MAEERRILDAGPRRVNLRVAPARERILTREERMKERTDVTRRYRVARVDRGSERSELDRVTVEEPLEIRVGAQTIAVTMRTPGNDTELAAGFLATEGIVSKREDIERIEYCREVRSPEEEGNVILVRTSTPAIGAIDRARRILLTTSSCGLCGKGSIEAVRGTFPPIASSATLDPAVLEALPDRLRTAQSTFRETGGLHAAGIFTLEGVAEAVCEDVGRHNAVDKAIGKLFLAGRLPLSSSVLLVSGRASFEIAQKALAAGIPIVAAVSAPSSLAVDLARDSGMTLVGFLRGPTFNVYCGGERLARPVSGR
jgi:FdhD protein